jgi:DNA-binding HxlR family transcriptional regulator
MTSYVAAVLRVLSEASEPLGWYQIERRLSSVALPNRPHLPKVLDELTHDGLVSVSECATTPTVRYALTPAGMQKAKTIGTG